ncbi:response regulator transcription factor [Qiania dongpingensis]|uniref:Stage 0 sporulation protein A homolog n=1 Tax=Qiania dongpingensis TaxID=2763669 RepID=A0A7G9G1Y9_9FIRM|nr:response regulator transcription factor [Qiania dongpingensis]QNM04821.1 response regulator transcription factor [Qiania dongpingensis]
MYKIAIIEDNDNIRLELAAYFKEHGYETACFGEKRPAGGAEEYRTSEAEAWENAASWMAGEILEERPDMILLDINLNETDGFALCRNIRKESKVPIIFVTGREGEWDELKGIRLGGDDFIRKPYSLPVLLARVGRMLERNRAGAGEIRVGGATLSLVMGQLTCGEICLELSPKELRMLYFLCLNQGKVVSRDSLMEYLWENKMYVDENILNVNLSRLRKRLADAGLSELVKTVPRKGYKVEAVEK